MAKNKEIRIDLTIDGKKGVAVLKNADTAAGALARSSQSAVSQLSKIGNIITGLNSAISIGTRLVRMASDTIEVYKVQEQAEKKLTTALGYKSEALLENAAALQKLTTHGDEEIIQAQALLAAFEKDESKIKDLTKATLDLADAKGMDLVAAADLVSKTVGSSTNALSRYGIEVTGAVGSSERLDTILQNINERFGGQAMALAETDTGKLTQAQNRLGDSMERVGALAVKIIGPIQSGLASIASFAVDAIMPVESAIDKVKSSAYEQMNTFEILTKRYLSLKEETSLTKDQQKLFNETIDELNKLYPNYLENVDLHNDSYSEVKTTLDKARGSLEDYTNALIQQAIIESRIEEIKKIGIEIIELEKLKRDNAATEMLDNEGKLTNEFKRTLEDRRKYGDEFVMSQEQSKEIYVGFADMAMETLKAKRAELNAEVEEMRNLAAEILNLSPGGGEGGGGKTGEDEKTDNLRINVEARGLQRNQELKSELEHLKNKKELTKKEIDLIGEKEAAIENSTETSISAGMAAYSSEKSFAENLSSTISGRIKAYVAEAVIGYTSKVMASSPIGIFLAPAAGIAAMALMNSIIPEFERGGWINGPSHSGGGVMINAEGGEYIVNRNAARDNIALLEAVNSGRNVTVNTPGGGFDKVVAAINTQTAELAAVRARLDITEFDEVYSNYKHSQAEIGD